MKTHNPYNHKAGGRDGFTFVEIVVVSGIFISMIGVVLGILVQSKQVYVTSDTAMNVRFEVKKAMNYMSEELRESGNISVTLKSDGTEQLNFQLNQGYNLAACTGQVCWGDTGDIGAWIHYTVVDGASGKQLLRCTNTNELAEITSFDSGCVVIGNNLKIPNSSSSGLFAWDSGTRGITINIESAITDDRIAGGESSSGVIQQTVIARNALGS